MLEILNIQVDLKIQVNYKKILNTGLGIEIVVKKLQNLVNSNGCYKANV